VEALFGNFFGATDDSVYRLSQQVLRGEHSWIEDGIIGLHEPDAVEKLEAAAEELTTA
jgi:hypothetical protein